MCDKEHTNELERAFCEAVARELRGCVSPRLARDGEGPGPAEMRALLLARVKEWQDQGLLDDPLPEVEIERDRSDPSMLHITVRDGR